MLPNHLGGTALSGIFTDQLLCLPSLIWYLAYKGKHLGSTCVPCKFGDVPPAQDLCSDCAGVGAINPFFFVHDTFHNQVMLQCFVQL